MICWGFSPPNNPLSSDPKVGGGFNSFKPNTRQIQHYRQQTLTTNQQLPPLEYYRNTDPF